MKNFLKENWFKMGMLVGIPVFIVIVWVSFLYSSQNSNSTTQTLSQNSNQESISVERQHTEKRLLLSQDVVCIYPQMINGSYQAGAIIHELPSPESKPLIFKFSNLQEENPTIGFSDVARTKENVPLIKIFENDERVLLIEGSGSAYVSLHTIFRNEGVSLFSKQVSLLGIPFGTTAVGSCTNK